MKCPFCGGSGVNETWVATDTVSEFKQTCFKCHGTGEVPMTNEEWLHTLDTEEMVDYLYSVHKGGASVERQFWIEKHKERVKMQFRGWLKQPHREE